MPKKQLPLFATQSDFSALMQEVCSVRHLEFAVMGLFDQEEPSVLTDPEELQPFMAYLAFDKGLGVTARPVPQRNGGMKYAVDPMENPQAIVLHCCGQLDAERLIAGDVSMATNDAQAGTLYALFSKIIRRRFEKIKSYYVGPEAARLLDQGLRLTPSAKSPETYDLLR